MTQMPVSITFSDDQAAAWDRLVKLLSDAGIDILDEATSAPDPEADGAVLAVLGKAGSGKTMLLAELTKALIAAGVDIVSGDYEGRRRRDKRTLAILAPTNKAASVLRNRGVRRRPFTAFSIRRSMTRNTRKSPSGWPTMARAPRCRSLATRLWTAPRRFMTV